MLGSVSIMILWSIYTRWAGARCQALKALLKCLEERQFTLRGVNPSLIEGFLNNELGCVEKARRLVLAEQAA